MKGFIQLVPFLIVTIFLASCQHREPKGDDHGSHYQIPDSVDVPLDEAYKMVSNYGKKAGFMKDGDNLLPDTRSSWVSLEYLEAYVKQLKEEKADGLRIYFATYSKQYPDSTHERFPPNRDRWGSNTVLLVSTRDSVYDGQHVHWDYFGSSDSSKQGVTIRNGTPKRPAAENHTLDCPPNCIGNELLQPK